MKGKILGFFCSLLLLAASTKGQTIDGVLYTNFNNYYKWRGGAFDSTLLLPQIAASIGRRPGALRYSTADSSVYSWTGTQWQKVGGSNLNYTNGLTQSGSDVKLGGSLNQSTTINVTSGNDLIFAFGNGDIVFENDGSDVENLFFSGNGGNTNLTGGSLSFSSGANVLSLRMSDSFTGNKVYKFPSKPTTSTNNYIPLSVNGNVANDTGNIVLNTDTATVVKAYVTNAEAVTITKGQVVYIFGASGDRASVKLAKNTSDTFSSKTLGIVRDDILAGQAGWITTQGQVSGINLGAYTAGDILWLDSIAGGFTKTKPVAPYHGVFIGVVERANAGNGLIYVKPQNGVELEEVHDVKITSPTNNQVLAYTSATQLWENKNVTTALGYTPLNVTDTATMLTPYLRSNVASATYQLILDTIPLAVFGAGSGAAGDTLAFSTSAVYGSFYNAGNDTLIITQMRAGVLGTSPSITTEVYWNDSLNITAGATILVTGGTSVTGTIGATNVTSFTNNKIPPNNWVFVRTSAVTTKPTYFTLTLLGYRKRQ